MVEYYSREQVAQHNTPKDAWLIIDNVVYNITTFAKFHPGGSQLLLEYAGTDVSEIFYELHRSNDLKKYQKLVIGKIKDTDVRTPLGPDLDKPDVVSKVPYSETPSLHGFKSLYHNKSHKLFRINVRQFLMKTLYEVGPSFELQDKEITPELYLEVAKFGLMAVRLGPGPHLHGMTIAGVKGEEIDQFHTMIAHEELGRVGCPSFQDGIGTGLVIGLPPVAHFANPAIKQKVVKECISGERKICLAVSEPFAGSDVANIRCRAELSECGTYFLVSGVKKWITNARNCDYFTAAVRTGGEGMGGVSVLLIENGPGVSIKKIRTSYGSSSGTSYLIFENVKVPYENLVGELNKGFKVIMSNFNVERLFIIAYVMGGLRRVLDESFKWVNQRKVFGQTLIQQPVIRQRLASMVSQTESIQHWMDFLIYQLNTMTYKEQSLKLGGPIALCKLLLTRVALSVSEQACQLFGGRAITRTGQGQYIERFQRSIKYSAILGGSEEIMGDLGIRMAEKQFQVLCPRAKL